VNQSIEPASLSTFVASFSSASASYALLSFVLSAHSSAFSPTGASTSLTSASGLGGGFYAAAAVPAICALIFFAISAI